MKVNEFKAAALFAVGAMLVPFAIAQGNGAQDLATNVGGKSPVSLTPGVGRGAPEGAIVIYDNGPYVNAPGLSFNGLDASAL